MPQVSKRAKLMKTLEEIYTRNRKNGWPDKGDAHSYIAVYEEILAPYRSIINGKNILEIGIFSGQSLRMWEQYFGGKVWGIDCSDQPHGGMVDLRPMIKEGTHNIIIMDAIDPIQVEQQFKNQLFDVVIDDASHQLEHQLITYDNFKKHMSKDSLYIIEDVQDIDGSRYLFEKMAPNKTVEILDRRAIKNRYDDVLILIK